MLQVMEIGEPILGRTSPANSRRRARRFSRAKQRRRVIEMAVIGVFNVENGALTSPGRADPRTILARQIAMYLAHTSCSMSLTDIARLYERDRTTVAYACAIIEDRRDDPSFDRALDLLSWVLPHMARRHSTFLSGS